jgi:hypothetical protein
MKQSPERRPTAARGTHPGRDVQMRSARPRSDEYTWPTSSDALAWSQGDRPPGEPRRGYYADEYDSRPAPEPYRPQGVPWFRQSVTYLATAAVVTVLAGGSIAYSLTSNSQNTVPLTPNTVAPLAPAQSLPPPAPVLAPPNPVAPPVQIPVPAPAPGGAPGVNESPGTRSGGGGVKAPSNGPRPAPAPPAGAGGPGAPAPPVAPIPGPLPPVSPPNAGQPVPNGGGQAPAPAPAPEDPAPKKDPVPKDPAPEDPAPAPKKPKKLGKAAPPANPSPVQVPAPEQVPVPQVPVQQAPEDPRDPARGPDPCDFTTLC